MPKVKNAPITISVPENRLSELKQAAAHITTLGTVECTYGDLIRLLIDQYLDNFDQTILAAPRHPDLITMLEDEKRVRGFYTEAEIEEFNNSDDGKMIAECIKTNDYTEYTNLAQRFLTIWYEYKSFFHRFLKINDSPNPLGIIVRDPATVAHTLNRRASIPNNIMEHESLLVPPFEIGTYSTYMGREKQPWFLYEGAKKAAKSYAREANHNFIKILIEATNSRNQVIETNGEINANHYIMAMKMIIQHGHIPVAVIMHTDEYINLHRFGICSVPDINVAFETGNYGNMQGVSIVPDITCPTDKIFMLAGKDAVGVVRDGIAPTVKSSVDPVRNECGFSYRGEHQLAVVNDYTVARIDITNTHQKYRGMSRCNK